jgi:Flp pilus assembly pilin Flp
LGTITKVMYQAFENSVYSEYVCSTGEGWKAQRPCVEQTDGSRFMTVLLRRLWTEDDGQDIAEYAVLLAIILVVVLGTIRLVGSNTNNVFSAAASSIQ